MKKEIHHETVNCQSCGFPLTGNFCAHCGEKRFNAHDLSISHVFEHVVEAFTHADVKIMRTLGRLVSKPGLLTREYLQGRRKPWLQPLQLVLSLNLVYFLLLHRTGIELFAPDWRAQIGAMPYSSFLTNLAHTAQTTRGVDFVDRYNHVSSIQAKSLLFLLGPLFSFAVSLVALPSRRKYIEALIFSLHFLAFDLLCVIPCLALTALAGGVHPESTALVKERIATIALLTINAVYLSLSWQRVYESRWPVAIIKGVLLSVLFVPTISTYYFILFFISYWTAA
jgi:hypothetical protein